MFHNLLKFPDGGDGDDNGGGGDGDDGLAYGDDVDESGDGDTGGDDGDDGDESGDGDDGCVLSGECVLWSVECLAAYFIHSWLDHVYSD